MASGAYDRDANLALLRLYNFEPELVHVQTVANVLIMALMQLPEADFTMLLHLIPENIQASIVEPASQVATGRVCQLRRCITGAVSVLMLLTLS